MNKVLLDNIKILEEINDIEKTLKKKVSKLTNDINKLTNETKEYSDLYKRIIDKV